MQGSEKEQRGFLEGQRGAPPPPFPVSPVFWLGTPRALDT